MVMPLPAQTPADGIAILSRLASPAADGIASQYLRPLPVTPESSRPTTSPATPDRSIDHSDGHLKMREGMVLAGKCTRTCSPPVMV